jgi:hypothetical protein
MGKLGGGVLPRTVVSGRGSPVPVQSRPEPAGARTVHRWRDLDRRSRRWALAVALALLLAPLSALVELLPHWTPNGDPALMALRALDVGTARTPLLGQPSQSIVYADSVASVHHPGPLHFYVLAVPVRLLGGWLAMPLVSATIAGLCLVTSAWAVFRQLGRAAGVAAAALLALVAFTTGAASMINPVSSVQAGYPLLVTAVLAWCLACGDVRLLPAAAAAASFTAQQHLSVVPATVVITLGGLALLLVTGWREGRWRDEAERRALARWGGLAGLVALVLWAPVLAQQAFGDRGNLSQMLWFARHDGSDRLGYAMAARQVAHSLGLPPLLGRAELRGEWLNSPPSAVGWVSAGVVLAVVGVITLRWRTTQPRAARLGAMAAVVVAAGLYNGAAVPAGLEQNRLTFYHWVFVLALFVALVVVLAAGQAAARSAPRRLPGAVLGALAVAVVAVPSVVNPALDRTSSADSAAYVSLDRQQAGRLADAVAARADDLGEHPVVLARDVPAYVMYGDTLAYALVERGVDVRFPLGARFFVHHDRLVDRDEVTGGVVLVADGELPGPTPDGDLVAELDLGAGLDVEAYRALVEAAGDARRTPVELGPELSATLSADEEALVTAMLSDVLDDPEAALLRTDLLAFLAEHPAPESPALDRDLAARVLASLEADGGDWRPDTATGIRVFVLDRAEVLDFATSGEIGGAG